MNLHPALSSLPTALLILVLIFEIFNKWITPNRLDLAIRITIAIAAVSIGAAFYSGYNAAETADQTFKIADDLISNHHAWGRILLFVVIPCALLRFILPIAKHGGKIIEVIYIILLISLIGLSTATGFLGGELVFKHGAGVGASH